MEIKSPIDIELILNKSNQWEQFMDDIVDGEINNSTMVRILNYLRDKLLEKRIKNGH